MFGVFKPPDIFPQVPHLIYSSIPLGGHCRKGAKQSGESMRFQPNRASRGSSKQSRPTEDSMTTHTSLVLGPLPMLTGGLSHHRPNGSCKAGVRKVCVSGCHPHKRSSHRRQLQRSTYVEYGEQARSTPHGQVEPDTENVQNRFRSSKINLPAKSIEATHFHR